MRPAGTVLLALLPSLAPAIETPPGDDGLVRTKVAADPLIKNPVSVSLDADGSLYVTETSRRKVGDLDIREATWWIPNDLSHTSVDQKRAFFRENVTSRRFEKHPSLGDANRDGRIDWRDLTVPTEKIHRLVDTDGDGVMDAGTIFATGFNTEVTGIAAGVLAHRGEVFATIAPDVWRLRDSTGDGVADQRTSIAHGFGVHINYAGHDMHGLIFGPDGLLYWTIGDKGTNVVSKEGIRWLYPHEGAVLRCHPDGSGFEVFARGLRNVQEIAFDDFGNLFGVDNDADLKGEKERLVFIPEGSDTGWRVYYQYRGGDYNPWMDESISSLDGAFRPAMWLRPIGSHVDGPSGFSYNPGTALDERYRGCFFVCQFPAGKINAFRLASDGAGFRMTDDRVVASGDAFIGSNFGPDGALYVADWQGGYPLNDKGAVWKIDAPGAAASPIRKEVAGFLREGPEKVPSAELAKRLGHPDQRVRLDAQWELARREDWQLLEQAAEFHSSDPVAVAHALWGLAQGKQFSISLFTRLAGSGIPEIRAQAAKWAGSHGAMPADLLADPSPRVRFQAALSAARIGSPELVPGLIRILEENNDRDAWLRHAASFALSRCADPEQLDLADHPSPAVRRGAILANHGALDRHFRVAPVNRPASEARTPRMADFERNLGRFLADSDPSLVSEAAIAIHAEPAAFDAFPSLAALLESSAPEPAIRRAVAACRQLATPEPLLRLARFAARPDSSEALRLNALNILATAAEPLQLDPVDGRWIDLPAAELAPATRHALALVLASVQGSPELMKAAGHAIDRVGEKLDAVQLARRTRDPALDPSLRALALRSLSRLDPAEWRAAAAEMLRSGTPALRTEAARQLASTDPQSVLDHVLETATTSQDLAERQAAISLLPELGLPQARERLTALLADAAKGEAPTEILLEILEAATAAELDTAALEAALKPDSRHLLGGGDADSGRRIYEQNLSANCTACHRIGAEGSNVGPALGDVGKKGRAYILESLIDPQARIADGFPSPSSMPPMALILSPKEIRDLVEFLAARQ